MNSDGIINPCSTLPDGVLGTVAYISRFPAGFAGERDRKERAVRQCRLSGSTNRLSRALFELAVITTLQGEPHLADIHLAEALALPDTGVRRYQILTQNWHCKYMQLQYSPDRCTLSTPDLGTFLDFVAELPIRQAEIRAAAPYVEISTLDLQSLMLKVQRDVRTARSIAISLGRAGMAGPSAAPIAADINHLTINSPEKSSVAALRLELADLYHVKGQIEAAESLVGQVLQEADGSSDLAIMASCYLLSGDWEVSSVGTPDTWNLILLQGENSNVGIREQEFTEFSTGEFDLTKARREYENAKGLFEAAEITRGSAAVLLRLGYLEFLQGQRHMDKSGSYQQALIHVSEARRLFKSAADWSGYHLAGAHVNLCRIGTGQLSGGDEIARECGSWGQHRGSRSFVTGIGLFYARYARRCLVMDGDYERSSAALRLAQSLFSALGLPLSHAFSMTDLACLFEVLGERTRFMVTAEQALEICTETYKGQFAALSPRLSAHAGFLTTRMMMRATKEGNPDAISTASNYISRLPGILEATPLQQIFALFSTLNTGPETLPMLNLTEARQQLDRARFFGPFYRSRKSRQNGKVPGLQAQQDADADLSLAETAIPTNSVFRNSYRALLATERERFQEATNLSEAYYHHRSEVALPYVSDPSLSALARNNQRNDLLDMAELFSRCQNYARANQFLSHLVADFGESWWEAPNEAWANLTMAGQICEGLGQFEAASRWYRHSMEIFEERRKLLTTDEYKLALSSSSTAHEIFFKASRSLIQWYRSTTNSLSPPDPREPRLQQAFEAAETGKARSLLDLMGGGAMVGTSAVDSTKWFSIYQQSAAQLAARRALLAQAQSQESPRQSVVTRLQQEITALEEEVHRHEAELSRWNLTAARAFSINARTEGLQGFSSKLPADTAVLYYSYWNYDLVAWAITEAGMVSVHHSRIRESILEQSAHRFHRLCETGHTTNEGVAGWLSDTLLKPFAHVIREHARLIIIPHRALHLVPFHTLPFDNDYLLATHTVSYIPSASIFTQLSPVDLRREPLLAIGNPSNMQDIDIFTNRTRELPQLRYAEAEAEYVRTVVPSSVSLVRSNATRTAVLDHLPNYRIIHFATHGEPNTEVPLLSAVYLADGDKLTVADLVGQQLSAKLVILSACESAQGELAGGDEVMGFARTLLAAGVQAVVVSLWAVDDLATTLLMEEFHKQLQNGLDPAAALMRAQNTIRACTPSELELRRDRFMGTISGAARADHVRSLVAASRLVQVGEKSAREARPANLDFSNPKFWGPFIAVGR